MHAEYPSIHYRRQSQVVEHFTAVPPDVGAAVLSLTLVVETVHLGDLPRLMVPSNEGDAIGVADFEGEKE